MNAIYAPINIIEKIKELKKNCRTILGDEPVVSNHIKKEIRSFTNSNNIEYQPINFDGTTKTNEIKSLFENESLFSNEKLFSISMSAGRVLVETKNFISDVIIKFFGERGVVVEFPNKDRLNRIYELK